MSDRDIVVDQLDKQLQELLSKLGFLSSLRQGEKIDVCSLTFVQEGWYTSISRTIKTVFGKEEGREITFSFINETTDHAIKYATSLLLKKDDFNTRIGRLILEELKKSKVCFPVICETYKSDRHFTSRILALEKILDTKILQVEETMK